VTVPQFVKTIVCLANSRKTSGRCVAGIELDAHNLPQGWIRPVSSRPAGEVSEFERSYEDGTDVQVLDVVQIPLIAPRPRDYQQENWLLDSGFYWTRIARYAPRNLYRLVAAAQPLWTLGHSSYCGNHDRVPAAVAAQSRNSLRLIEVSALRVSVFSPGAQFGDAKRRVQGHFTHSGVEYRLWITDPKIERHYLALDNGNHDLGSCYLTISLGESFNEWVYKLIATVIPIEKGKPC